MTSTKTLIIFAHRLAEAVETHQRYSLFFFFFSWKRGKKTQLIVKTVSPFKETVQRCCGWTEFINGKRQGRGLSGVYSILILFAPNTN